MIEVRPLVVTDVFTIARMLSKVTKGARTEIASAITAKEDNPTELGMAIFQGVFIEAEEDLKGWLASLVGKPKEEFEVMPATAIIDIIDELIKQEGIKDFFVKASQLATRLTETG